jgi:hypothetical protein
LARIVAHATHAHEPQWFTTAPVGAIQKVLDKAGWKVSDVDLFEVNEGVRRGGDGADQELGVPHDQAHINGRSLRMGIPIGWRAHPWSHSSTAQRRAARSGVARSASAAARQRPWRLGVL